MAHNRLPSLFGNLFRLAIKGVLAPFIGEFLITVIEEASHTSIFFKDFDKKILRLLKELHAEEENLKLLTHSLNELTPTLLVMCSAFAESLNNSYLTCSE